MTFDPGDQWEESDYKSLRDDPVRFEGGEKNPKLSAEVRDRPRERAKLLIVTLYNHSSVITFRSLRNNKEGIGKTSFDVSRKNQLLPQPPSTLRCTVRWPREEIRRKRCRYLFY